MPLTGDELFKSREQIVADLIADLQVLIPDAHVDEDSLFNILFQVLSGEKEGITLSMQQLLEDFFIETAGLVNLRRLGDQYGLAPELGTKAVGNLLFSGAGGTPIAIGTEATTDESQGDPVYFLTTALGTIPNPGVPAAPTAADGGSAGNVNGTVEYAVTFLTAGGETEIGAESLAITVTNRNVSLTNIPTGGTGTTGRRVYRSTNGADYKLLTTINDNSTTIFTDNVLDAGLGGSPPADSTAERISIPAESEEAGLDKNVLANTIIVISQAADGVYAVTNPAAFAGGTDEETLEDFRKKLLQHVRNPGTGSVKDIEAWAKSHALVETATAFKNDNLGVATNGHTTTRIGGPGGTIPVAQTVTEVLAILDGKDMANIIHHVATFTPVVTAVTVTLDLEAGFILADVTPDVQAAIRDYINSIPPGGLLSISRIHSAAVAVNGVESLVVNSPATDQATAATDKRTPGVITVN